MNLVRSAIKIHKGSEKWPLFVNKQLLWWSALIPLDNNNDVFTDFLAIFRTLYLPHTSVGLTYFISLVFSACKMSTHMTTTLHVVSLLNQNAI